MEKQPKFDYSDIKFKDNGKLKDYHRSGYSSRDYPLSGSN